MPFFEGKQELYTFLCHIVLPLLVGGAAFGGKWRRLWVPPVVIFGLFLAVSGIFYPYLFTDIITGSLDTTAVYWLLFTVPIEIAAALLVTLALYGLKRRSKSR